MMKKTVLWCWGTLMLTGFVEMTFMTFKRTDSSGRILTEKALLFRSFAVATGPQSDSNSRWGNLGRIVWWQGGHWKCNCYRQDGRLTEIKAPCASNHKTTQGTRPIRLQATCWCRIPLVGPRMKVLQRGAGVVLPLCRRGGLS
ncbi:hypothetical protein F5X99DRAFT_64753 [Biscogniauxia marginata]|nr:hypothetical protein F5X99DRAFT_64753 [Biscogniauxia marginata]